jgi:hypothetical protein
VDAADCHRAVACSDSARHLPRVLVATAAVTVVFGVLSAISSPAGAALMSSNGNPSGTTTANTQAPTRLLSSADAQMTPSEALARAQNWVAWPPSAANTVMLLSSS